MTPVLAVLSLFYRKGDFRSMEIILVKDMVREMAKTDRKGNPVPFSITFVTCNLKQDTGGEKITLKEAVCIGGPSNRKMERNPKHAENFTRNIRAKDGDRFIKIHALLVTRFNGKKVSI